MKINLHIERIVLDGLPVTPAEQARVRASIESELKRLLIADRSATNLQSGGAVPRITAPSLRFTTTDLPDALGRGIARSIHGGLSKGR
jgi:hypothetical protein